MITAIGLGAWGLLPLVAPIFLYVAARLGAVAFAGDAEASRADRAVAGVVLSMASVVLAVEALSLVHAVTTGMLVTVLTAAAVALGFVSRAKRKREQGGDETRIKLSPHLVLSLCPLFVGGGAAALATVAARLLPVWQWDSLGYHLPFVHFTLAARSTAGVPSELEYIGSYPHDVELFFVALRACLPDDRLVDLGQIPLGMAGGVVTACIARQWGAPRDGALIAGASWLVVPAVFLQLPTDYVDVGAAAFLLAAVYFTVGRVTARRIALAGVALGLFVGSKPSAPPVALLLAAVLVVQARSAGEGRSLLLAMAATLVLGAGSYLGNLVDHGNPVWPVRIDIGPVHLAGEYPVSELLAAGANAPRLHGPLPWRMLRSLVALSAPPSFDMRYGGFGPVLLCALPLAIVWLTRQRSTLLWLVFGATVLSPDPAVARYVLAFPALVLAAAAASLHRVAPALAVGVTVLGVWQLVYAAPGLTGEGPPLGAYFSLSEDQRAVAVGADGPPTAITAARRRIQPGEAFAFDQDMDLCDLAWDAAGSYRVVFLRPSLSPDEAGDALAEGRVRVLVTGDRSPAHEWLLAHPLQFERLSALPSCRHGTCSLYARH